MKVLIAVSCLALMLSQVVHGFSPVSITGADAKTNTMRNPTELQVWNDPYAYGRNRYSPYVMPRRDNGMDSGYRRIGMNGESYRGYGGRRDSFGCNGGYYDRGYGGYDRGYGGYDGGYGGYGRGYGGSYNGRGGGYRDPYYSYGGYDNDRSRYDRDWYGGRGRDNYGSSRRYDYGYPEYGYGGYGGARMTNREIMDRFSVGRGGNYGYYGRGRGGRYNDDYYY